jgi:hypothetical protein
LFAVRIFAPLNYFNNVSKNLGIDREISMDGRLKNPKTGMFAAVAFLTLLGGPAYSQDPDSKTVVDPDSLYQNKVLDRRYQDVLSRQPDGQASHDPWGSVRASDTTNKKDNKKNPSASVR